MLNVVNGVSLNFNLREPRGNKLTNVYAVVRIGDRQIKLPIGCRINSWQWDRHRQLPAFNTNMTEADFENATKVFQKINDVRFRFLKYLLYLCHKGDNTINIYKIKNIMTNNINLRTSVTRTKKASTLLKAAFEVYYSEVRPSAKESTKTTMYDLLSAFFKYCNEVRRDKASMLSQAGINDYKTYLVNKSRKDKKEGKSRYDSNTQINSKCEVVVRMINKVLCSHSQFTRDKILSVNYTQLEETRSKGEDKRKRPLTEEELRKIANCEGLTDEEKEYRDLLLLQCRCGNRISDIFRLFDESEQTRNEKDGITTITITTTKEGTPQHIVLTDEVKDILGRYEKSGLSYAKPRSDAFNAKYNKMLRRIARKAGLNSVKKWTDAHGKEHEAPLHDIISSHFARYTKVHELLTCGFTSEQAALFTGHSDGRMINDVYGILNREEQAEQAITIYRDNISTDKANAIGKSIQAHTQENDKLLEYKDVLAFYGEPYINYGHINDEEELLRIIIGKYESRLKDYGYDQKKLKGLYNSGLTKDRDRYIKLQDTIANIISQY